MNVLRITKLKSDVVLDMGEKVTPSLRLCNRTSRKVPRVAACPATPLVLGTQNTTKMAVAHVTDDEVGRHGLALGYLASSEFKCGRNR